jgi:hypothetical protein
MALGNNSLEVIDLFAGRVIPSIKGLAELQGPLYVPAVASDAQQGTCEFRLLF